MRRQDLLSVGFCITEAFSRLASEDRPTEFALTDDQMAILRAVAMGACEEDLRDATLSLWLVHHPRTVDLQRCSAPGR